MSRLRDKYKEDVVPALQEKFGYTNIMQVPKLEKILVTMRFGDIKDNTKAMEAAVNELAIISGQKPIVIKAKRSVSNFKLRKGMDIAAKVTLRAERMYEFADKLINIAIPRIRDFRGVNPASFDGRGNYAMGVKEQLIFPEINYDQIERIRGLDIVIVTTADTDEEGYELLRQLGMPFAQTSAL
ncbi:MAG: 50S ribosomal protein L5 [Eubacteriaceae bacterium]|nr:50S ribosomal protein L5 [Eubacteriaceae bacterium]